MFRLGQNTRSRLPKGIFVSLQFAAVAWINSTTVYSRSLFSCGSRAMRDAIVRRLSSETVRMPAKLGIARVDSDGGLRSIGRPPAFD